MSRRLISALIVAVACIGVSAATVSAQGSPTCVEANDIREWAAGNFQNVGVYQRTFGAQAEAYCRHDHGDGPWSADTGQPIPASTPTPAPVAQGSPPSAPRAIYLLEVGSYITKIDIRPPLDGGGLLMQGYRWELSGSVFYSDTEPSEGDSVEVEFYNLPDGTYIFSASAFNARGEGPVAFVGFTIRQPRDPLIQRAIDLLWTVVVPVQPNLANILDNTRNVPVVFGAVPGDFDGFYRFSTRTISIIPDYRNRPVEVLAITVAHELMHAGDHIIGRNFPGYTTEECYAAEVRAYRWSAAVGVALGWRSEVVYHWRNGTLDSYVRSDPDYQEQCAA